MVVAAEREFRGCSAEGPGELFLYAGCSRARPQYFWCSVMVIQSQTWNEMGSVPMGSALGANVSDRRVDAFPSRWAPNVESALGLGGTLVPIGTQSA